jgi:hypothetical protein
MKKIIFLVTVFSGMMLILQGCYTILDIPESDSEGYVTYIEYIPVFVPDPVPVSPPPTYYPPINGSDQPVVTTPQTKDRTNGNGNGNIRNDGNGRGDSGRDNDFIRNNNSQTTNYSSSNNNTSSNNSGSSGVRNSGSGRR